MEQTKLVDILKEMIYKNHYKIENESIIFTFNDLLLYETQLKKCELFTNVNLQLVNENDYINRLTVNTVLNKDVKLNSIVVNRHDIYLGTTDFNENEDCVRGGCDLINYLDFKPMVKKHLLNTPIYDLIFPNSEEHIDKFGVPISENDAIDKLNGSNRKKSLTGKSKQKSKIIRKLKILHRSIINYKSNVLYQYNKFKNWIKRYKYKRTMIQIFKSTILTELSRKNEGGNSIGLTKNNKHHVFKTIKKIDFDEMFNYKNKLKNNNKNEK